MSERFERIYRLTDNLYSEGAPLIISAGALLKDTETGRFFAQLKFKNISLKQIKAITVKITPLDTIGKPIGNDVLFSYLDLCESRDAEFGQKKAIPMPDSATRSFSVEVVEVAFVDNTVWTATANGWIPMAEYELLEKALHDQELVKQFKIRFGSNARYQPKKGITVWRCTCGAINSMEEKICHFCACEASALFNCNLEELKNQAAKRVEQENLVQKNEAKKRKKIAIVLIPLVVIGLAVAMLISRVVIPNKNYNQAIVLLNDGQYEAAIDAFQALGDYKDATEKAESARVARIEEINAAKYSEAERLFENGDYSAAKKIYQELDTYKDSPQKIEEIENIIKYANAERAISAGDYYSAYRVLITLDASYKDTASLISKIKEEHPFACVEIGDVITFGSYEQDNNTQNGKEPIEWFVIDVSSKTVTLYSKYCLDAQPFNTNTKSSWENTTLYKWLNSSFRLTAFSSKEKRLLAGPINLMTSSQAWDFHWRDEPLLLTNYVKSKDNELHIVWLALDAEQHFSYKSDISTGGMWYDIRDVYPKGWSVDIVKKNLTKVTDLGGVCPLIIVNK